MDIEQGEVVWYDDSPGRVVEEDGRGSVTVDWDHGGRSTVSRSDLLTNAEYTEMLNG